MSPRPNLDDGNRRSQSHGTSRKEREGALFKEFDRLSDGGNHPNNTMLEIDFHRAVMGNDVVKFKKFIEAGIDPNVRGYNGSTALHAAARVGNLEMINALIEAKVEINLRNYEGFTALDVARNSAVIAALIAAGGYRTRGLARMPRGPAEDSRND